MRLARTRLAEEQHRLGLPDPLAVEQPPDPGLRERRRALKVEPRQRLDHREPRLLEPPRVAPLLPLVDLGLQQADQELQRIRALPRRLTRCPLGVSRHARQAQLLTQISQLRMHQCTAPPLSSRS